MTSRNTASTRLQSARYASLRSFRRDGTWVETPIWFARESEHLYLRTGVATAKIKRIQRDPEVELRPSNYRGRYEDGVAVVLGIAGVCGESEQRRGEALLKERYGWQWNVIPMIPLPGLSNPHPELTIKDRIAWARSKDPWPGTCVVKIELADG
jgi:PPOX class probable F420-dependent enzyme